MTDEELDALVKQAMDRAIERLQKLHDYAGRPAWDQVLREELSEPFTTLRAQLAEALFERDAVIAVREMLGNRWANEKARAEAAEAKLAECEARLGKVVEALENVHRFGVITHPAIATLAEIKGETK